MAKRTLSYLFLGTVIFGLAGAPAFVYAEGSGGGAGGSSAGGAGGTSGDGAGGTAAATGTTSDPTGATGATDTSGAENQNLGPATGTSAGSSGASGTTGMTTTNPDNRCAPGQIRDQAGNCAAQ
jgi:hypothetical protein